MAKTILTSAGKKKLIDELQFLSTKEKNRMISELADAKDRGGVSENAEYEIAKEQYQNLQIKISQLESKISNCVVISSLDIDTDKVSVLSTVRVLNKSTKSEAKFTIVPETDIDIKVGKISLNSPIAVGLLGKKVGEIVKVVIPAGTIQFEVLEITA